MSGQPAIPMPLAQDGSRLPVPDQSGRVAADGQVLDASGPVSPSMAVLLSQMLGARPAARKHGDGIVCVAPMADGTGLFEIFQTVPEGVGVAGLLSRLSERASAAAKPQAAAQASQDASAIIEAAQGAAKIRKAKRQDWFATEIADLAGAQFCCIVRIEGGKARRFWFGASPESVARKDEIKLVLERAVASAKADPTAPKLIRTRAGATDAADLDAALIAKAFEAAVLAIALPSDGDTGHAVVLAGPNAPDWLADAPALANLLAPSAAKGRLARGSRRLALLGAGVAAAIWMALPAPLIVTATGEAVPAQSRSIALPFAAFVDSVHVQAGAAVSAGDLIAELLEPDLAAQLSEQEIALALEQINANAALDAGDYAAFQLAESRSEIAALRIAQIEDRLAMLRVASPIDGTVIEALEASERGQFLTSGTTVARIQPTQAFDVVFTLPSSDAPIIAAGQQVQVRFRGLGQDPFPAEITGFPEQRIDPQTNESLLFVRARITDGPQDRLLVGLTGAARITVGDAPRIYGWTRPALEYLRYLGWRYFGLQS